MTDIASSASPAGRPARRRLDTILVLVLIVIVVALLGVAAYFGYTVYRDRKLAENANPSLRMANALKPQINKDPNNAALRVRYAEALASAQKWQDAIEQLNAALKIDPKHVGAYLDLALIARATEHPGQAEGYFKKVIALTDEAQFQGVDERRDNAFYNLGLLALDGKRYEEAIGYFKESLRIRKDASDTYYWLAQALIGVDDPDQAMKQLEIALAFDPKFAEAHFLMGQLYDKQGDKVNAAVHYKLAADAKPDAEPPQQALAALGTAEEWFAKAQSAEKAGQATDAINAILIARTLDPKYFDAAKLHGDMLLTRKDVKGAVKVYQEALAMKADAALKAKVEELQKQLSSKK